MKLPAITHKTGQRLVFAFGAVLLAFCAADTFFPFLDPYVELVMMYAFINVILTLSLNIVNGYMGEFSVGHAGFMALGAYAAAWLTEHCPGASVQFAFPFAVLAGGVCAGLAGLVVGSASFKTRGDYLAIITLAFGMIVKSALENIDFLGGPHGMMGIAKLSSPLWVFLWAAAAFWCMRNFIYSSCGRAVISIREDEIASTLAGVNTRRAKLHAFVLSAFFTGIGGALYAHLLQFINPRSFDILKSTDMLVMVYLGGIASLTGSVLGAVAFTLLLELLRPLGVWRMVAMPLMLVLLMLFRRRGIMGMSELKWLVPADSMPEGGEK